MTNSNPKEDVKKFAEFFGGYADSHPEVKKELDFVDKIEKNKKQAQIYFYILALFWIVILVLDFLDKLNLDALLSASVASFFFLEWLIETRTRNIHERIDLSIEILFEEINKLKKNLE